MSTKDSKYISYIIGAFFAIVPFIHHSEGLDKVLWPQSLFLGITTLILAIYSMINLKDMGAKVDTFSLFWLLFFVLSFLGVNHLYSIPEWLATTSRYLLYGLWSVLLFNLFRSQKIDLNIALIGLSIGGLITATQASLAALQLTDKVSDIYLVSGLFGHKNFTSAAILLYLPASVYLIFQEKKQSKYLGIATALISLFAIGILRTRGVWLGTLGGLSLASLLLFISKNKQQNFIKITLGAIIAFVCILGITLSTTASGKKVFDSSNVDLRLRYWSASLEMIKSSPLTGVGSGQWKINFPQYGLQDMNESVSEGITAIMRPHNDFLWVTSELGILGGVVFLALVLISFYATFKTIQNHSNSLLPISLTIGLVGYFIYGLGEFPIERTTLTAIFIFYGSFMSASGITKSINKPRTLFYSFLLVASSFVVFVSKKRLDGEVHMSKVIVDNERRDPINIVKHADQTISRYYDMDFTANPVEYFAGMGLLAQQKYKNAQERFESSLNTHPWHIVTLNQFGNLYKYQKQFDRAIEMYNRALAISPKSQTIRLNKAEVLLAQEKYEEAAFITLSCFGDADFYQDQKYRGLIIQSFRMLFTRYNIENSILEEVMSQLDPNESDAQLFQKLQAWKDRRVQKRKASR